MIEVTHPAQNAAFLLSKYFNNYSFIPNNKACFGILLVAFKVFPLQKDLIP